MAFGTPQYADSPSSAERGPPEYQADKSQEARLADPHNNSYEKYSRPDSKVWSLYLNETDAEDKELVQVWQTGIDSLLVFAGLFAGVLASFLLESRTGLQDDPQQAILREIYQVLRNESTSASPPFQPSTSSLSINFLWFISLAPTLFSALSAVLAKGWIDTYLPASSGKDSGDACERHLRVIRAYQWHLDGVLGAIPLLLQLSLLLFLVGLVIFILDDNKSIGVTISALIALTTVLYIVVTLLPRLSPACPFRTTLSTFVPGTDKNSRYKRNDRSSYKLLGSTATFSVSNLISEFGSKPEQETVEAMILAWILANSTREDAKEEAFKAIAGLDRHRSLELRSAMQEYITIPSLCMQLKTTSDLLRGRDDKVLGKRLPMEEASSQPEIVMAIESVVPHIVDALKKDPDIQVRCQVLRTLGEISKQPELLKVIESVVPDIIDVLKDTNIFVRCHALRSLGEISEQPGLVKTFETLPLFVDALKDTDPLIRLSALNALGEASKQPELVKAVENVVPHIVGALKDSFYRAQGAALIALIEISKQPQLIGTVLPHIFDTLKDPDLYARGPAHGDIFKQPLLIMAIEGVVPDIINALNDANPYIRGSALSVLREISNHPELLQAIEKVAAQIVDALEDADSDVRDSAMRAKQPQPINEIE